MASATWPNLFHAARENDLHEKSQKIRVVDSGRRNVLRFLWDRVEILFNDAMFDEPERNQVVAEGSAETHLPVQSRSHMLFCDQFGSD